MPREEKKRIDTQAAESSRSGLNSAFSNLNLGPLPAGPATPTVQDAKENPGTVWKLGRVVLRKETAHRGGKTVIVVHDFASHLPASVIEAMAKKLRHQCGTGGTVRGRTIEIQGEQAGKIRAVLEKEGFQVAGVA